MVSNLHNCHQFLWLCSLSRRGMTFTTLRQTARGQLPRYVDRAKRSVGGCHGNTLWLRAYNKCVMAVEAATDKNRKTPPIIIVVLYLIRTLTSLLWCDTVPTGFGNPSILYLRVHLCSWAYMTSVLLLIILQWHVTTFRLFASKEGAGYPCHNCRA